VAPLADLWKWSKPLIRKKIAANNNTLNGLVCLKGGDLAPEIAASTCRPRSIEIYDLFKEEFFKQKISSACFCVAQYYHFVVLHYNINNLNFV